MPWITYTPQDKRDQLCWYHPSDEPGRRRSASHGDVAYIPDSHALLKHQPEDVSPAPVEETEAPAVVVEPTPEPVAEPAPKPASKRAPRKSRNRKRGG